MSGRVTAIEVNPTDKDHIYNSTAGGVWMSRNHGVSFEPVFDKQQYLGFGKLSSGCAIAGAMRVREKQ